MNVTALLINVCTNLYTQSWLNHQCTAGAKPSVAIMVFQVKFSILGGGGGTDYMKVTTGVPLGRILFEIQKALSEAYDFQILPYRRVWFWQLALAKGLFLLVKPHDVQTFWLFSHNISKIIGLLKQEMQCHCFYFNSTIIWRIFHSEGHHFEDLP